MTRKGKEREVIPEVTETKRAGPSNIRERLRSRVYQRPQGDSNAVAGPSRLESPFEFEEGSSRLPPDNDEIPEPEPEFEEGSSRLPPDDDDDDDEEVPEPEAEPEVQRASKEQILETLGFVNRIEQHTAKMSRQLAEAQAQADAMREHLAILRKTKMMMRARRQRMQAFVEAYERQPRKLPYETLWGPKNGKLIVNTAATDDDHHNELWMSETELKSWGVNVSKIPEYKTPKGSKKRKRDDDEEDSGRGKKKLLEGLFVL